MYPRKVRPWGETRERRKGLSLQMSKTNRRRIGDGKGETGRERKPRCYRRRFREYATQDVDTNELLAHKRVEPAPEPDADADAPSEA